MVDSVSEMTSNNNYIKEEESNTNQNYTYLYIVNLYVTNLYIKCICIHLEK